MDGRGWRQPACPSPTSTSPTARARSPGPTAAAPPCKAARSPETMQRHIFRDRLRQPVGDRRDVRRQQRHAGRGTIYTQRGRGFTTVVSSTFTKNTAGSTGTPSTTSSTWPCPARRSTGTRRKTAEPFSTTHSTASTSRETRSRTTAPPQDGAGIYGYNIVTSLSGGSTVSGNTAAADVNRQARSPAAPAEPWPAARRQRR